MAKGKRILSDFGGLVYSTDPGMQERLHESVQEEVTTLPPQRQLLRVSRNTKGRGGKVATVVEGFVGRKEDLEELGKRLKCACGVGGSSKEGLIIVQGDRADTVVQYLVQWGYTGTKRKGG